MFNRWVLSRDRKTATEGAEVTRPGRLFQTRAAATGKARSPTVRSRVRLTISDEDELERSRWRASTSATCQSSPVRYADADPWSVRAGFNVPPIWHRMFYSCTHMATVRITLLRIRLNQSNNLTGLFTDQMPFPLTVSIKALFFSFLTQLAK